jgi:hypothetical protein
MHLVIDGQIGQLLHPSRRRDHAIAVLQRSVRDAAAEAA